jgi:hypothetical protein
VAVSADGSGNIGFYISFGIVANSGLIPSIDTPYFIVVSASSTAQVCNFLLLNLRTGTYQTASISTSAFSISLFDSRFALGTSSHIGFFNSPYGISAAMASDAFLSIPQMLAWAQDPWSFWYPPFGFAGLFSQIIQPPVISGLGYTDTEW